MIFADNTPICSIDECANSPITRGWCETHYRRWIRTGNANHYVPKTTTERFWNKVDKSGDCWVWTAGKIQGYGSFSQDNKHIPAHRYSWFIHNGPIPDGLLICHHCDNRPCVNPAHLFLGTRADNQRDMAEKGRSLFGERNSRSKLTEADVLAIRGNNDLSRYELAELFNVSYSNITSIITRQRWKHI
jgi:hypothetical protein